MSQPEPLVVKVGMVGDAASGKTSLRRRFLHPVAGNTMGGSGGGDADGPGADESLGLEQVDAVGVNCVDKTVLLRGVPVVFSLCDLPQKRRRNLPNLKASA